MPSVLLQPAPFIDSRFAEAAGRPRRFFVILTVTFRHQRLEVRWTQQAPPAFFFSTGESPNRGLEGLKSRRHRHRTGPHGVDHCRRCYHAVTTPPPWGA